MKMTVFEAMMQMSDLYTAQAVSHSNSAVLCLKLAEETRDKAFDLPIEEGSQIIEVGD